MEEFRFFEPSDERAPNLAKDIEALDRATSGQDNAAGYELLQENIIKALEAGADPRNLAGRNTVLTAAIVHKHDKLINFIFEKYNPEHPIFSLPDHFISNTPLSLALKTGRYDLAKKLIEEKKCDVNGLVVKGNDKAQLHPLHLCAFLLGTYHGQDNAKDAQLVSVMKEIIRRGGKAQELFWGKTPEDLLMLNIDEDDFKSYVYRRGSLNFFEYYLNNPFTPEEVAVGEEMDSLRSLIATAPGLIAELKERGRAKRVAEEEEELKKAEAKLGVLKKEHPKMAEIVDTLNEYNRRIRQFIMNTKEDSESTESFCRALSEKEPRFAMIQKFDEEKHKRFWHKDLINQYGHIPEKMEHRIILFAGSYCSFLYALMDHCQWHRDVGIEGVVQRRNGYFQTPEGMKAREELLKLMTPFSPRPE